MPRRSKCATVWLKLGPVSRAKPCMTHHAQVSNMRDPPPGPIAQDEAPSLPGFDCFRFEAAPGAHWVFRRGDRDHPPVLVLQELPGIAPGLLLFVERLAAQGFQVYLPWLFGPLGARAPLRNLAKLCVSREFARLRAGTSAPVTDWLRALAGRIAADNSAAAVSAIGMCITGAFVIPLLLEPGVRAAVAAQPSVPLSWRYHLLGMGGSASARALNVSAADLLGAAARLARGEAKLLAVRCAADRLCPPDKLQALAAALPAAGLTLREYGHVDGRNALGQRPHATYTKEFRIADDSPAGVAARQAFEDLLAFLRSASP
ncbi:MAG: hypothetical protein RL026_820 [Pseudomonadota bacterium]